jgi:hypothetical protein
MSLTPVPEAVEHAGARPGQALAEEVDRARRLPSARSGTTGLAVTGLLRLVWLSDSLPTRAGAVEMDAQRVRAGPRSAPSPVLVLWRSSAGADGAPIVEIQHYRPALPLALLGGYSSFA